MIRLALLVLSCFTRVLAFLIKPWTLAKLLNCRELGRRMFERAGPVYVVS
jgi:hypothetical protein